MSVLSGERMLVVEDEYFVADDMAKCLTRMGAEVVGPVANLDDAQRLVATQQGITGAILDINLRSELSYPLADELERRHIPYIFATGYGPADIPSRYRHVPRWEKPYDMEQLALSWAHRRREAGDERPSGG